jgi:hypothetical protein
VDSRAKPIKPSVMSGKPLVVALVALLGCSSNPAPEAPLVAAEPEPSLTGPSSDDQSSAKDMPGGSAPPAATTNDKQASIPDDYQLTNGDCTTLGKQFAAAWRMDEVAKLSPKLNEKQRSQAEKSLDEGATKAGDKFAEGCNKSLVGQTADPKSLKCAMDARSVKIFDACLNGDASASKEKK